ncbi:MAG: phytanoyl-CoA dioxygenase family protein [Lentisphaeria bacterium]|nr:phytanoyl-CoA dioxygenase family protein [Lentisphaeria bacterium]
MKNIFPLEGNESQQLCDIAVNIAKLPPNDRKDVFSFKPEIKRIFEKILLRLAIDAELTSYCFFLEKSAERNWPLAMHQDINFPDYVKALSNFDFDRWTKDGFWIRLNLDAANEHSGALLVEPKSHLGNYKSARKKAIVLNNESGEVILFKPLLFHGSDKMKVLQQRRVIQVFCISNH